MVVVEGRVGRGWWSAQRASENGDGVRRVDLGSKPEEQEGVTRGEGA